jgi:hypothetical protein
MLMNTFTALWGHQTPIGLVSGSAGFSLELRLNA